MPPKTKKVFFQITDKEVYRTFNWTVETENESYIVVCQEDQLYDMWAIINGNDEKIDNNSEIGKQLIELCLNDK